MSRPVSEVRLATDGDREAVSAMLARAFADDPAFVFILPDATTRVRRLERLFRLLYDSDGRAGMRLVTTGGEAATLWRGPGRSRTGWGEVIAHALPLLHALGGSVPRALRVSAAIDAHMPTGDFWYLHIAGCEPAMQGQGLGGAAIRAGLERVAGRLPCYLETATEANVGFYAALGFAVTESWQVPEGPRFWSMLRSARQR